MANMKHGCLIPLILILFIASGCAQPQVEVPTPTPTQAEQASLLERIILPPGYDVEVIYSAPLACPAGIALAPTGDFLIVENDTHNIKEVTPEGKVSTIYTLPDAATAVAYNSKGEPFVGGNVGIWKLSPEGKPSKFSAVRVSKIAFGPDGYLYTVNWHEGFHPEIMKISPQGEATIFFTGLSHPSGIAFSPSGELYVADPGSQRIVKVNRDGTVTTIVDGLWTDPIGIDFDKYGTLYFTSGWAGKDEYGLYRVSPTDGSLSAITLSPPLRGCCEDITVDEAANIFLISITYGMLYKVNPQGEATILVEGWHNPMGMVVGPSGELFIADFSRFPLASGRILKLDMQGNVTTFTEDLKHPIDLIFDTSGNLFVSNPYGQILKITSQGEKQVVLKSPINPQSLVYDPVSGDLFVFMLATDEILRITPEGDTSILAGDFGEDVFSGRVAVDNQGNLFACVVYAKNYGVGPTFSSLFKIAPDGNVKLLAEFRDEVPCAEVDLAVSPSGDAFLLGHPLGPFEIRKITPEGEVSIFATHLPVDPFGITFNAEGDLFFSCATGIYRIFRTG